MNRFRKGKIMLPTLDDKQRAAMFRWGVLISLAAMTLGPSAVSPASSVDMKSPADAPSETPVRTLPAFAIPAVRLGSDPFVAKAADVPAGTAVRAVIFGGAPRALIEIGGKELMVGVGDAIAGVRVLAIEDRGVSLSDGSFIPIRGVKP
jgi:hypothetical protein